MITTNLSPQNCCKVLCISLKKFRFFFQECEYYYPGRQTVRQTDRRTDRRRDGETDRQTNRNERPISSYCRGHEKSRKHKSRESVDGLDYHTSFAYTWKMKQIIIIPKVGKSGSSVSICLSIVCLCKFLWQIISKTTRRIVVRLYAY